MAEGTEKEASNTTATVATAQQTQNGEIGLEKTCQAQEQPQGSKGSLVFKQNSLGESSSSCSSIILSSTESLTINDAGSSSSSSSSTIEDVIKCTISNNTISVELCNNSKNSSSSGNSHHHHHMTRERSKTPPAVIMSHHYHQSTQDFISSNSLKSTNYGEKSRDSGVHLDEVSSNPGADGDDCDENGRCCPTSNNIPLGGSTSGVATSSASSSVVGGEVDPTRRHSKSSSLPHGVKLCPEPGHSSITSSTGADRDYAAASSSSLSDREDDRWMSLEEELRKAHMELREKDAEVEVLKGIRSQVEGELEDLTASLFEEAHKMVKEAKMKEVASEKSFKEAKMQLEGLQAEVSALKALLITSTPSRPNLGGGNGISLFKKQHKRTPSHNHLQYGRADDETNGTEKAHRTNEVVIDRSCCEVDPILLSHFAAWRVEPNLSRDKSQFLQKMYTEDIDPCLCFANQPLVIRLKKAIEDNSIWVEPLPEKDRTNVPKDCALLCCPRVCHYRMRFAFESDEWFDISQISRDRIAAVCEFLNYLRYIKNGLVKASVDDAYWEMLRLRKQIALAKLGISIS